MSHYFKMIAILCSALILAPLNAATFGQTTVIDPVEGLRTLTYEQINSYALVEGDIIIGKNLKRIRFAVTTPVLGGSRWPGGIIPFVLHEDLPFKNKLAIMQAMDHWQKYTRIRFVELTAENRYLYPDYIAFVPAPGTICASYVGRQRNKQEINLSPRCNAMNTVHEIGHALGLWHEQSRADRDSFVRIAWENIEDEHMFNFEQHLSDGRDFGEYDYQSIMHYGPYAFSKNGLKTIIPLVETMEIGQRDGLSAKDIAAIDDMYPEL